MTKIQQRLFELKDEKYRDFNSALIPTVDKNFVIGVRMPDIRALAKNWIKGDDLCDCDIDEFLQKLPHEYFEENCLHASLISLNKNFDDALALTQKFLPYVDNWAVCDTFDPKAFAKDKARFKEGIYAWLASEHDYTVRFGVISAMRYFLDDDFDSDLLDVVLKTHRENYYVNMAVAWYLSVAIIKRYDIAVEYLLRGDVQKWIHNKGIQKATESRRISDERKTYLKSLKIK